AAQASDVVSRATGWDPDHARRVTAAAGDVAVAVTGLLRELSRTPASDAATGTLREGFAEFASHLARAAGVDLHADPEPASADPWRLATVFGSSDAAAESRDDAAPDHHPTDSAPAGPATPDCTTPSTGPEADPWRAATRAGHSPQEPR
ncbi:MAG: hypothetical protein ACRDTQ_08315, partial [Micromonosporaceae bacterium]